MISKAVMSNPWAASACIRFCGGGGAGGPARDPRGEREAPPPAGSPPPAGDSAGSGERSWAMRIFHFFTSASSPPGSPGAPCSSRAMRPSRNLKRKGVSTVAVRSAHTTLVYASGDSMVASPATSPAPEKARKGVISAVWATR